MTRFVFSTTPPTHLYFQLSSLVKYFFSKVAQEMRFGFFFFTNGVGMLFCTVVADIYLVFKQR